MCLSFDTAPLVEQIDSGLLLICWKLVINTYSASQNLLWFWLFSFVSPE